MALTWKIDKSGIQEDSDSMTLVDNTVYGTGGNPARADRANVLFVTKTDKDNNRELLAITPNTADPLTVSEWSVPTLKDGWYEKIIASVTVHVAGQSYASADIILFYDGVFYKTKSAVPISNDPPNATYYDVITAESLYTTYLENSSMEVTVLDELVTTHREDQIQDLHEAFADSFLAHKCSHESFSEGDFLDSLLNAAESAFLNNRPQDAEEIIRGMETYYVNAV